MNADRVENVGGVAGLSLLREAVPAELAQRIVRRLQGEHWKRWTHRQPFSRQEFGYEYNIRGGTAAATDPIPGDLLELVPAIRAAGWEGPDPTQVIVNRYPRGGGIRAHIDKNIFGPEIAAVSLETEWPIIFSPSYYGAENLIALPVLSAYVMRGDARTRWYHKIAPQQSPERISITFRTMAGDQHHG